MWARATPPRPPADGKRRFRILGPLELWDGERWVAPGPAKTRALLAVLLIQAGRVVSVDTLAAQLWAEQPPPSAVKLVQVYVSRLRRTLRDPDGLLLITRPPGYQLLVPAADLDSGLFETLVAAARQAMREGEPARALQSLDAALSLWSGPALADVSGVPAVDGERLRLEEHRMSAVELRMDAALDCGLHETVRADLEALACLHPLRERIRGQLMVALYRSGRQAEALATYQDLRHRLRTDLGIEPGPPLQRVHLAILRADPSLEGCAADVRRSGA